MTIWFLESLFFECAIFVRTIRVNVPLEVNIQFSVYTDNKLHPFVNKTNLKKDQRDLKDGFKIFDSSLHLISIIFTRTNMSKMSGIW